VGTSVHCPEAARGAIVYHWERERWHLRREAAPPPNPQGPALPAAGCAHNYVYKYVYGRL
jgi:hypothetical protein